MSHKKAVRTDPLERAFPPGGADSHAHLDDEKFDRDREAVLERARLAGLTGIGNVFLGPQDYAARKHYFDGHPEVFFLLGIHPCDGLKCDSQCLEEIEAAFRADSRIRAVGEIGLDFHWGDCPRELQMDAFARQLQMARKLGAPVVLHCREAEAECLALLEGGGFKDYPLLWHCFGGDASLARRIIRNGWHISLPGPLTYPANSRLREAAAVIPGKRLLLETDCPYLAPMPWRGTRNEPAYVVFTAREAARAREEDPDSLWQMCGENTREFFGLKKPAA